MTSAHDPHQFQSATDALDFILAGNAYFTLRSLKTGKRLTYRVNAHKERPLHFVSVLTGPDNTSDYTYIGTIKDRVFRWGKASTLPITAPSVQAIEWALTQLVAGRLPTSLEVWHQGRCGRCGRLLTVPESIDRGLGPECAGKAPRFAATAVAGTTAIRYEEQGALFANGAAAGALAELSDPLTHGERDP